MSNQGRFVCLFSLLKQKYRFVYDQCVCIKFSLDFFVKTAFDAQNVKCCPEKLLVDVFKYRIVAIDIR